MSLITVIKRDGSAQEYDGYKLCVSLAAAVVKPDDESLVTLTALIPLDDEVGDSAREAALRHALGDDMYETVISATALVESVALARKEITTSELQELTVCALSEIGAEDILKRYVERARIRRQKIDAGSPLMTTLDELTRVKSVISDVKRDNANVDGETAMGTMLQYGSVASKAYALNKLIPEEVAAMHGEGALHIHDLEFYALTLTCIPNDRYLIVLRNERVEAWRASQLVNYICGEKIDFKVWSGGGFVDVKKVMSKEFNGNILTVRTLGGGEIKVTKEHFVTVAENGIIDDVVAMELRPGMKLLRDGCDILRDSGIENSRIWLREWFAYANNIYLKSVKFKCTSVRAAIEAAICEDRRHRLRVTKARFKAAEILNAGVEPDFPLLYTTRSDNVSIQDEVPLSNELARLMGYVVAGGTLAPNGLRYSAVNKTDRDDFIHCVRKVLWADSLDVSGSIVTLAAGKILLHALFNGPFGTLGDRSVGYKMPVWLGNAPQEFLENFARALAVRGRVLPVRVNGVREVVRLLSAFGVDIGVMDASCLLLNNSDFNEITSIHETPYSGMVFDLETENHHFAVDGFKIHNCCQIDLDKLFENGGFNTGHGNIRTPNSIEAYAALTCIAIQSNQNEQHGGQSVPALEYFLKRGVAKTLAAEIAEIALMFYERGGAVCDAKAIKNELFEYVQENRVLNTDVGRTYARFILKKHAPLVVESFDTMWASALRRTERRTAQALEAFIYNLNTMHCLEASERLWVYDTQDNRLVLRSIEWISENFKAGRYKAISLNPVTGEAELKEIYAVGFTGVRNDITRVTTKAGQTLATTSNHKFKFWDIENNEISDVDAGQVRDVLTPRRFDFNIVKGVDLTTFNGNLKFAGFAYFCGLYVAHGSIVDSEHLLFDVFAKETNLEYVVGKVGGVLVSCVHKKESESLKFKFESGVVAKLMALCGCSDGKPDHGLLGRKRVPDFVLLGDKDIKKAFLCGLYKSTHEAGALYVSKDLAAQIRLLGLSLGALASTSDVDAKVTKVAFDIEALIGFGLGGLEVNPFEEPKYNFGFMRPYLPDVGTKVGRRLYDFVRVRDVDEFIYNGGCAHTELLNLFVVDVESNNAASNGRVFDISVRDNESFLTEDGIFVHNSRAGAQIPFSSVNFGTDTSWEGRLVSFKLLDAIEAGLGKGETPMFPISVFKMKKGINVLSTDPNYDLFKKSIHVTARRMYPNFANLDAPFNAQFYEEGNIDTEIAYMGCVSPFDTLIYTIAGETKLGSFEQIWDELVKCGIRVRNAGLASFMDLTELPDFDFTVMDTRNSAQTSVCKLVRNTQVSGWFEVTFENGQIVHCTADHPWPTTNGRRRTDELVRGDVLFKAKWENTVEMSETDAFDLGVRFGHGGIELSELTNVVLSCDNARIAFIAGMESEQICGELRFDTRNEAVFAHNFCVNNGFEAAINDTRVSIGKKIKDFKVLPVVAVKQVRKIKLKDTFSYDFETASGRFDLSFLQSFNCRTRVIADVNGAAGVGGRGNLSFTTVNLPQIALLSEGSVERFFEILWERMEIALGQLRSRMALQAQRSVANMPFLMGQGVWKNAENLDPHGTVEPVLKHGTLALGFVGLAETLIALLGVHHGESEDAQKLGLEIIGFMRQFCDQHAQELSLNVTLLATPAESAAGRLLLIDRNRFGVIERVTDRDYYTNSFHVPVWYKISARRKVEVEAPYHALTNAGHITYVELDGAAKDNELAVEDMVMLMYNNDCGFFAVSHALDRDPVCGYSGYIGDGPCPGCGREEFEDVV
jgi:anaerobic ribonucleoside-triphosphate reductase